MCAHGVTPSTETVEVFENERRPILESHESGSSLGFSGASLLAFERHNFSDRNGHMQLENPSRCSPNAMLPEGEGWQWEDVEWTVDKNGTDSDGWQYAPQFVQLSPLQRLRGEDVKWYDACDKEGTTYVRRKRWVRKAVNTRELWHTSPIPERLPPLRTREHGPQLGPELASVDCELEPEPEP
jgi:hypothetical protein